MNEATWRAALRTLAHISDLHFGRTDPAAVPALRRSLLRLQPALIVVSGDLTQRARRRQFREARDFLDSLPFPKLAVPGNHDVPLYDAVRRWLAPLARYRRFISREVEPFYGDHEIAVQGLNTARSLSLSNGRLNPRQVERCCARLAGSGGAGIVRIVVTHHPFDEPEPGSVDPQIGRREAALAGLARCRVDLILSGHWHRGHSAIREIRVGDGGSAALLIRAGTATSSRRRGEPNSYNVIRIDPPSVEVERLEWLEAEEAFVPAGRRRFRRTAAGMAAVASAEPSDTGAPVTAPASRCGWRNRSASDRT